MVLTSKTADMNGKKERRRKKNSVKSKAEKETLTAAEQKGKTGRTVPDSQEFSGIVDASEIHLPPDPQLKNLFIQKSKTLIDFRRKPVKPEPTTPSRSDWNQLSFRKRINHFIQNSPLLRRANYLKHTPSLKSDLNRLSDSLENLKIEEDKVLGTLHASGSSSKPFQAFSPLGHDSRRILTQSSRSKSCHDFDVRKNGFDEAVCPKCAEPEMTTPFTKSGSLLNLSDKTSGKLGSMKRSASLQLSARPWTWILGSTRQSSKENINKHKYYLDDFCNRCGLPMYLFQKSSLSLSKETISNGKIWRKEEIENLPESDTDPETNGMTGRIPNTPLTVKEHSEKGRKSGKLFLPEREEQCKSPNEYKGKTQDWARKLVGSIRRKVGTKKASSPVPEAQQNDETFDGAQVGCFSTSPQKETMETAQKKTLARVEAIELSPKMNAIRRKMSLTGIGKEEKHGGIERKLSQKGISHQKTFGDEEIEGIGRTRANTSESITFEKSKIRRKLSFPSAGDAHPGNDSYKLPKKKDTTLLSLIFKKQASFDVKKETKAGEPFAEKAPDKIARKIPDFSFSNSMAAKTLDGAEFSGSFDRSIDDGATRGRKAEGEGSGESLGIEGNVRCGFADVPLHLNLTDYKWGFSSGRVGATPKTMSRSCGQVEIISSDPAVRENFLKATMSIFLAVSPPSGKMQVRSRSLTHIDHIEQGQSTGIFFPEMEKGGEQLAVPSNAPSKHRRHMLSRSEANSSECFTVGIEGGGDDDGNEEFVQASNDTILRDALSDICKRRGIDLASANVFLDANKSPLPCLDIDTSWMGGKHIRIKVNDRVTAVRKDQKNTFIPSAKKKSSNYKGVKSGSRTHNVSSEEPSATEPGPSSKPKRWSGFFGTSRDTSKMETLVDLLDSYTKNGIYEYKEDIYKLESDWKSIVSNSVSLDERQSQQQEAIWELLRSEIDYIKMLRVVSHLFIACLVNLQSNQLLLEIDNKKLFGNVEEIYSCNDSFYKKHLMAVVEASRKTGDPLNPDLLKDGFMEFPNIFKCYETYCTQQSRCQMYCREKLQQDQDNELFTAYLAWCETQKECNRLKLLDILVKPMQRLTKYSLLLKAILKRTTQPNQKENLVNMIRSVDSFVNNVNSSLRQNQDLEIMRQLMSKIESYDVIESKDDDLSNLIQKYSNLNLTFDIPGTTHKRSLIFESDVKYKDAMTSSKIEIHAFLFTDFLLITKPVKRLGESKIKFKIIRQPFVIEHLVTQEINREPPSLACVYLSVYKTACTAFMLSCGETELVKSWSEAIKKAKGLYASLRSQPGGGQTVQTPTAPFISRQPSGLGNEDVSIGDNIDESKTMNYNLNLWTGRSPRGSSYGSRISSLVHSHSGSMEMTENMSSISSVSASRGVSVENNSEIRGSSLSSDDGNANLAASSRVELTTSPRAERKETQPLPEKRESPILHRPESKSFYRKSITKTKNTLTIQVPHLGQSLPNLNIASTAGVGSGANPCPPNSLFLAPPKSHGGLLSPSQRGVSYPPPSPPRGSLKRGFAIVPKNPLVKTGNVNMELSRSLSVNAPSGGSNFEKQTADERKNKTIGLQTDLDEGKPKDGAVKDGKCSQCSCTNRSSVPKPNSKRLVRSDKRYNVSGIVEDSGANKDSNPSKKSPTNSGCGSERAEVVGPFNKLLGIASVQSSSGFSSAGSSAERLFPREEVGGEGKKVQEESNPFKFEEILQMINLKSGNENAESEGLTDVEKFDSKVSKWQKYGFDDDEKNREDHPTVGCSSSASKSPFITTGLPTERQKLRDTDKQGASFEKKYFAKKFEFSGNSSAIIEALHLEHIFRLSRKEPADTKTNKRKRKRRVTF